MKKYALYIIIILYQIPLSFSSNFGIINQSKNFGGITYGKPLNKDYNGEELLVVVILKGSMIFAADLVKELTMPVTIDFMRASSYGSGTASSGFINIKQDLGTDISGKNVLIIEDIIDSGNTLHKLKELLRERNPKTIRICTLLDKPARRVTPVDVEYSGIAIPDEYVVGYGLDYNEILRNLPYVGVLKREIYE